MKLPEHIQQTIADYMMNTFSTQDNQTEFHHFADMLSPSLKHQVFRFIYRPLITQNQLFEFHGNKLFDFVIKKFRNLFPKPE